MHEIGEKDKISVKEDLVVTDEQSQKEEAVPTEVSKDEAAEEEEQRTIDTADEAIDDTTDGAKKQDQEMKEGVENVNEIEECEVEEDKGNTSLSESGVETGTDEEEARELQTIAGEAVVGRWSRWRRQRGEGRCCNPSTSPLVAPWLPLLAFP